MKAEVLAGGIDHHSERLTQNFKTPATEPAGRFGLICYAAKYM
jgi:hypothetical protein